MWSHQATSGMRIATTTSEVELLSNNVTDGLWTTSGLSLVINEWRFIATLMACGTAPTTAWRVWAGTATNAPTEITVTQNTAPAGAFTGNTNITLGNLANGTVAFQGLIGDAVDIRQTVSAEGPLQLAAFGAITQDDADLIYRTVVVPIWKGDAWPLSVFSLRADIETTLIPGDLLNAAADTVHARTVASSVLASTPSGTMTLTNVPVKSQERCPRAMSSNISAAPFLRR